MAWVHGAPTSAHAEISKDGLRGAVHAHRGDTVEVHSVQATDTIYALEWVFARARDAGVGFCVDLWAPLSGPEATFPVSGGGRMWTCGAHHGEIVPADHLSRYEFRGSHWALVSGTGPETIGRPS